MINPIMLKVWNVVLRNRRAPQGKSLCVSAQLELTDAVQEHFDILLKNNRTLERSTKSTCFSLHELKNNCKKLVKYNVSPKPDLCLLRCIMYRSHLLEHRIRLLQELGFHDITVKDICSLRFYMEYKADASGKKSKSPLYPGTLETSLKSIKCWPIDVSDDLSSEEDPTAEQIYKNCMSYHLRKNLQLPTEIFMTGVILDKKYRFYSFKMIQETLEILTNVLGFDILQCPKALLADPNEILSLVDYLKEARINRLSPQEVICQEPEILFLCPENIRSIMDVLRSYDINEEKILENLKIFNDLDKDKCIQRVEELKKIPEIWIYRRHPLFLFVLRNFRVCLEKLEYIKTIRKGETPIQMLQRSKKYIERNQFSKYMKHQMKSNIYYILEPEFKEHTQTALDSINKHPNFEHAKPTVLRDTVAYLREQFPIDMIARNGEVLLYQRDILAKALEIVRTEYSTKNRYEFSCEQYLQLAQYLLERNIGFIGDSILYTEFPNVEDILHLPPQSR